MFENNPVLNLDQNLDFCLIYIQKEISGEKQLKETNLKSLGLTQGRAAMKLVVRPPDALKGQAFVESLNLKKFSNQKTTKSLETTKQTLSSNEEELASKRLKQQIIDGTNPLSDQLVKQDSNERNEPKIEEIKTEKMTTNEKSIDSPVVTEKSGQTSDEVQEMEVESEDSSDESQQMINYLGHNYSQILFKMSDLPKVSKYDFPDQFYETTKDDLVTVLNGLRRQQVENNEKQLETKQSREQKKLDQKRKYKTTVIRICFPNDGLVFQAIFKPNDTIKTVMEVLANYVTPKDFYLYTVPPKRVLSVDSTLYDTDLVPAAVIHFGTKCDSRVKAIKDELKDKLSSYKSAAKIAIDSRKTATNEPIPNSSGGSGLMRIQTNETGNTRRQDSSSDTKEKKSVPKWFKTNK